MKTEQGFTIVELVIVVAIIGMLAAMAIPNYQKFVAIARQAEAKGALSGMYTAEQSFFAEFNSYTQCLNQAGYSPVGSVRYYSTGFMTPTNTCGNGSQTCYAYSWSPIQLCDGTCGAFAAGSNDSTFQETETGGQPLINSCAAQSNAGVPLSWSANQTNFIVGAAGSISSSPLYDMWQIDNNKNISNVQSGL